MSLSEGAAGSAGPSRRSHQSRRPHEDHSYRTGCRSRGASRRRVDLDRV